MYYVEIMPARPKIQYSILVRYSGWQPTMRHVRRTIASQDKQKFPLRILNAEVNTYSSDQVLRLSGTQVIRC